MIYTIFRLPHKGLRQNPTESDMPDLSDLSDYVGLCRILSDFVGFFVGFVGCDVGFCRKCWRPLLEGGGGGPLLVKFPQLYHEQ